MSGNKVDKKYKETLNKYKADTRLVQSKYNYKANLKPLHTLHKIRSMVVTGDCKVYRVRKSCCISLYGSLDGAIYYNFMCFVCSSF